MDHIFSHVDNILIRKHETYKIKTNRFLAIFIQKKTIVSIYYFFINYYYYIPYHR